MIAKRLVKGDEIRLVAPSKKIDFKKGLVENFKKEMKEKGFEITYSKNMLAVGFYGHEAGTPKQRADDINEAFADENVKAIWCVQGGSPANQVLDLLDWKLIKANPKLVLGKSDIDVLLLALNKITELVTIHTCDSKVGDNREFDFEYTKKWFEKRLINGEKEIQPSEEWTTLNPGVAEGKLIGCNISCILKLAGTKYFPDFTDSILFLETYEHKIKEILCRIEQYKQIGVFDKINGLVIGHNFAFEGEKDGLKAEEMIVELIKSYGYDFPVLKINEFGHYQPHAFLPIGAKVKVDATNKKIEILDDFVL
jgi:muramoyltetrapeptide carboxypeptidase